METKMWSWSAGVLTALMMIGVWVWPKFLMGLDVHPIFGWLEANAQLGWIEPGARWVFGAVALLVAVAVVLPKTRVPGAIVALVMSIGFMVLHFTPLLGFEIPSYEPLMAALANGATAAEIEAMGLRTDRSGHFTAAFTIGALALITWLAEKAAVKAAAQRAAERAQRQALAV